MIPPKEASFVWNLYFTKLRGTGLTLTEIKAYQDLYGQKLALWEIDALFLIHSTIEGVMQKKAKEETPKAKPPRGR